jgi:hypothetical protein
VNGYDLPNKSVSPTRPFSSALKVALRFDDKKLNQKENPYLGWTLNHLRCNLSDTISGWPIKAKNSSLVMRFPSLLNMRHDGLSGK